ncbi:hypothetical protein [Microseira wollei]|uniref:Glycosyltransferase RgtA/B/C/D-like domain-containing protein n=1 Tax=Microseira wollei NIES-4236 TaxID=2530354 RepID=A0AAV3XR27_9CYAN|nr:hypothetical protein [Microseira wollei]GET44203.1 hypothetical protein MiSe_90290 [Microseira wollei NIES-4236]
MHIIGYLFYLFIIIVSLFGSIWIFKKLNTWEIIDRFIAAITPLAVLAVISIMLIMILQIPFNIWNNNRLTPAFALAYDYKFFNAEASGPILSWMYGPIAAIAYLPSTLAKSPTVALIIAGIISIMFFFTPILLLGFKLNKNLKDLKILLFSFVVFAVVFLMVAESPGLNSAAFTIHADAPSLGLAGAACIVLYYSRSKTNDIPRLLLSSMLAILAIWTKQNLLPLPLALLTYILLADSYQKFKHYAFCFLFSGVAVSLGFIYYFGADYLYFTMLKYPSSWPWVGSLIPGGYAESPLLTALQLPDRIKVLSIAAYELVQFSFPFVLIIIFYCGYQVIVAKNTIYKWSSLREWLSNNRWSMLLIVAIYMTPVSLLSRVKLGGAMNSLSVTLYFLLLAVIAIVVEVFFSLKYNYSSNKIEVIRSKELIKLAVLSITILLVSMVFLSSPEKLYSSLKRLPKNPVEVAYKYAKKYPNQVYFPQIPLSSIMADSKLYHSFNGLYDRDLVKFKKLTITQKHFLEYVPSDMKIVAFYNPQKIEVIMNYLPDFSQKITIDELPKWVVFIQENRTSTNQ